MRTRGIMLASLAAVLALGEGAPLAKAFPPEPEPPKPRPPNPKRPVFQKETPRITYSFKPPTNGKREVARRLRQMERAAARRAKDAGL